MVMQTVSETCSGPTQGQSMLLNTCVSFDSQAVKLISYNSESSQKGNSYLIEQKNGAEYSFPEKIEIFIPENNLKSMVLNKTGMEGSYIWSNDMYSAEQMKNGWVIRDKKSDNIIYMQFENDAVSLPEGAQLDSEKTYCFEKKEGADITKVNLSIIGNNVTGTMDWMPRGVDGARGTLSGSINNAGELDLIYDYTVEGSHQTEEKVMKIQDNTLMVKHGKLVDKKYNGNLTYIDKNSATYTEVFNACK